MAHRSGLAQPPGGLEASHVAGVRHDDRAGLVDPCGSEQIRFVDTAPAYGGVACEEGRNKKIDCNMHPCPIDCVWSDWTEWGSCLVALLQDEGRPGFGQGRPSAMEFRVARP